MIALLKSPHGPRLISSGVEIPVHLYPYPENEADTAVMLGLLEAAWDVQVQKVLREENTMTVAIMLLPHYVKHYSTLSGVPYETLKDQVWRLLAKSRVEGML